jgi:hypothetical protein
MHITQIDTSNRQQVKTFLDLPFELYRDVPQWVPPLASDARRMLDRRRHPFYRHSDAAFFLAVDGGRTMGRIAVLDNHNYNAFHNSRTAFFYLFECQDDLVAAQALFDTAFEWARSRGLTRIIGPKGLTVLDSQGLLVKGFEHRPSLGIPYNLPTYPALVEATGFVGIRDLVSGHLDESTRFPERIHQVAERVKKRRGLRVARFERRRDLRMLVPKLRDLYNDSLGSEFGNIPITEEEAQTMANQLLWFADPHLIKVVMKDDDLIGFVFAYPDITAALQRTGGRLFPFGWITLLREFDRTEWVTINGAGIVEEYRGLGGTVLLFSEVEKSIREGNFQHADLVQIGTDNDNMQRELEKLGVDFYKTHRIYGRAL